MFRKGFFDVTVELYSQNLAKNASRESIEIFAKRVFSPQKVPTDYLKNVGVALSRRRKTIMVNIEDLNQKARAVSELQKINTEIQLPVEIIHGEKDWLLNPQSYGKRFSEKVYNSNFTLLDGMLHMAHHVRSDCVNNAIQRIL